MTASSRPSDTLVATALMILLGLALVAWGWSPILANVAGDNAVYWFTAHHFSPWASPSAVAAHFASHSIYPPLYPLLLAFTGGGDSVLVAHVVSVLIVALALPIIYICARRLDLGPYTAVAIVVLFVAARTTLLEAIQLHSEHLYLLLSLCAVALLMRSEHSPRVLYASALLVAAACLTRSFGAALALAFVAVLAVRRPTGAAGAVALAVIPVGLWTAFGSGNDRYLAALLEFYRSAGVGPRLATNIEWAVRKWAWCFGEAKQAGFHPTLAWTIGAAALSGALLRARQLQFDGLYSVAGITVIVLWPYPAEYERFYYPLLPLLLAQGVYAVDVLADRLRGPRAAHIAAALLLILALAAELPFLTLFTARLVTPPDDPGYLPYRRTVAWFYTDPAVAAATVGYQRGVVDALADIRAHALPGADGCLRAIKPPIVSFYSGYLSHALPRPAPQGELLHALQRGRCQYLFMTAATSPTFTEPFYPYERLRAQLEIIEVYRNPAGTPAPAAILARLRRP